MGFKMSDSYGVLKNPRRGSNPASRSGFGGDVSFLLSPEDDTEEEKAERAEPQHRAAAVG